MSNLKGQKPVNGKGDNIIPVDLAARDRAQAEIRPVGDQAAEDRASEAPKAIKPTIVTVGNDKPASEARTAAKMQAQESPKDGDEPGEKKADTKAKNTGDAAKPTGSDVKDAKSDKSKSGSDKAEVQSSESRTGEKDAKDGDKNKVKADEKRASSEKSEDKPSTSDKSDVPEKKASGSDEAQTGKSEEKKDAVTEAKGASKKDSDPKPVSSQASKDDKKAQAKASPADDKVKEADKQVKAEDKTGSDEAEPVAKSDDIKSKDAKRDDFGEASTQTAPTAKDEPKDAQPHPASDHDVDIPDPLDFSELFGEPDDSSSVRTALSNFERARVAPSAQKQTPPAHQGPMGNRTFPPAEPEGGVGKTSMAAFMPDPDRGLGLTHDKDLIPDLPWAEPGNKEKAGDDSAVRTAKEQEARTDVSVPGQSGSAKSLLDDKWDVPGRTGPGGEDPIADAVQSALRNVYGDTESGGDEMISPPSLDKWEEPAAPKNDPAPKKDSRSSGAAQIDDETAEAVLSYLYDQTADADEKGEAGAPASKTADDDADVAHEIVASAGDEQSPKHMEQERIIKPRTDFPRSDSFARQIDDALRRGLTELDRDTSEPAIHASRERDHVSSLEPADIIAGAAASKDMRVSAPHKLPDDSGRLLGAAGLGLIGGIALAGILSVFIFNSFVSEPEPGATPSVRSDRIDTDKVQARLASQGEVADAPTTADPAKAVSRDTKQDQPKAVLGTVVTSGQPETEPVEQPSKDTARESKKIELAASDVSGAPSDSGQLPLDLRVPQSSKDAVVRISGLPAGAKLSAGIDTGGGSWLLSAKRAKGLALAVPEGYSGTIELNAQLLAADARTELSKRVPFTVKVAEAKKRSGPKRVAALPSKADSDATAGARPVPPVKSEVGRGHELMRAGDILAARKLFESAAQKGNAEAALAMGQSFDPIHFGKLKVKTGKPDAARAFQWYKKAQDLGLREAQAKINELKKWLLR